MLSKAGMPVVHVHSPHIKPLPPSFAHEAFLNDLTTFLSQSHKIHDLKLLLFIESFIHLILPQ